MNIKETLEANLKLAMREQDTLRKNVIRLILSALKLQEVELQRPVTDAEVTAQLYKEVKLREETIADARKINRTDIIEENLHEIEVVKRYLPKQMDEDELCSIVDQVIAETGVNSVKGMGLVVKEAIARVAGAASNAAVSAAVSSRLTALEAKDQ